ncbi:MAG: sulfotransferase [Saprospiraceae bacterium]|nr:sulfotransferase [Saprospiraceae bacterium]
MTAPFIVGVPRSGTTLLRIILDAHPDLSIPPETGFIPKFWQLQKYEHELCKEDLVAQIMNILLNTPDHAPAWSDFHLKKEDLISNLYSIEFLSTIEGLRSFYRTYANRFNKKYWGDKTPGHAFFVNQILEMLPEAKIIHMIRDGRDVAVSLRNKWFGPGHHMEKLATIWCNYIQAARKAIRSNRYLEIRFEDLITCLEDTIAKICLFLGLEMHDSMLHYYQKSSDRLNEHVSRFQKDNSLLVSKAQRMQQSMLTTRCYRRIPVGTLILPDFIHKNLPIINSGV